jgi:nucleolar GTP-binding protein
MTAITALAHLPAAVLFFVDVSEMCGYPIATQVALYHSIKPLFRNRPLLIVLNKADLRKMQDLTPEEQKLIESMKDDSDGQHVEFFTTSCYARRRGCSQGKGLRFSLGHARRTEGEARQSRLRKIPPARDQRDASS